MSQRAIVVAGASGFVGRALVEFLTKRGHKDIRAVSRATGHDLRDPAIALSVCKDVKTVYHLAAQVGGIGYIGKNDVDCLLSSQITLNLLRACEENKVERLFFSSSSCV